MHDVEAKVLLPGMKNILLIEDEPGLSRSLAYALKEADLSCISVSSGEEGLASIAHNGFPDLIILDLILPGMNGVEVLKSLKSNPQTADIPIIVLTNVESEETIGEVVSIAKSDYLIKSNYTLDEVVEHVKRKLKEYESYRKEVGV